MNLTGFDWPDSLAFVIVLVSCAVVIILTSLQRKIDELKKENERLMQRNRALTMQCYGLAAFDAQESQVN